MPTPKMGHTGEEILYPLRELEAGETGLAVCRKCRLVPLEEELRRDRRHRSLSPSDCLISSGGIARIQR